LIRYRCPKCRGRIKVQRLYDSRYIFSCNNCKINYILLPSSDNFDIAYVEFLESYDEGKVKEGFDLEKKLIEEGLLRSKEEILSMISSQGLKSNELPKVVKHTLESRQDYIVDYRLLKGEIPRFGKSWEELGIDKRLVKVLKEAGVIKPYKFQEKAIEAVKNGDDLVIVAPTGSGKTEAFAIPIIDEISKERYREGVRAVFTYPTKALSRDQLPKLRYYTRALGLRVEVFDGDTPKRDRERIIEEKPEIVITNFDSLHLHMMHRTKFSKILRTIRYLVVDEIHTYIGTFGSNVHFIIKRLERLVGKLQVIGASATLANPKELAENLLGRNVKLIKEDEGRRAKIHFVILFPTLRSRWSLVIELARLLKKNGYRTLIFSNSHFGAELTAFNCRNSGVLVEVHRAGLMPEHRRRVEEQFKHGILDAISSTPTLELGIDIGIVNAVVSELVPINRLIQRIGRIGRRGQESIAFLALRENDPISQHYRQNPHQYYEDFEYGYVDPKNPVIAKFQLLASALDKPLRRIDYLGFEDTANNLEKEGFLIKRNNLLFPAYQKALALLKDYDIRGSGKFVSIYHGKRKIGERNLPQAIEELHPGAIYFLAGKRYKVTSLFLKSGGGKADVEPLPIKYPFYTKPLLEDWPIVEKIYEKRMEFGVEVIYCDLRIKKKVIGYVQLRIGEDMLKGEKIYLDGPVEYEFKTKGIVFKAPIPIRIIKEREKDANYILPSGFHATEHVIIEGTNMVTGGVAGDLGGISLGSTGLIFIYDASEGGNGASRVLFERFKHAILRAKEILYNCSCKSESGCPRCTYSYKCGNNNEYLHKGAGIEILQRIVAESRTSLKDIEEILINKTYKPIV
jgi:DEAD/DEAH box helicase domain-containing protein